MTLVITACTNRKRMPVSEGLHASTLPQANLADLVKAWCGRIDAADDRFPAADIYGGRGFQEAVTVARALNAPLLIVSAGLGLIPSDANIPSYACTVVAGARDSVTGKLDDSNSAADWWRALSAAVPMSVQFTTAFDYDGGLVLAALSDAYIDLVAAEAEALPVATRARLRLFTRAPLHRIAATLRPFVMPYDDRLDGLDSPVRGTRSDFPGRALRHFTGHILTSGDDRDASAHADAVSAALNTWTYPERPQRVRHDDPTLRSLIARHWDANGGCTSRLLPFFRRELNIACEQGRFAALVNELRSSRL